MFVSSICDSKSHNICSQSLKYNAAIMKYNENKYMSTGTVALQMSRVGFSICDSKTHDLRPQSLKYNRVIMKYNGNKYMSNSTVILSMNH